MDELQEALHLTLTKIPVAKKLSQNRLGVLVLMVFNMGVANVLGFTKMLTALENGDYSEAATEILKSTWGKKSESRANELCEIMITDKF